MDVSIDSVQQFFLSLCVGNIALYSLPKNPLVFFLQTLNCPQRNLEPLSVVFTVISSNFVCLSDESVDFFHCLHDYR